MKQTAIVLYRGSIQAAPDEEQDIPLRTFFYSNLAQEWEDVHPGWHTTEDDFDDPYEHLRSDKAYESRRAAWDVEARRLEVDCWRRLGPGPKGWRIVDGRYEIGNLEPVIRVLSKSQKQLRGA